MDALGHTDPGFTLRVSTAIKIVAKARLQALVGGSQMVQSGANGVSEPLSDLECLTCLPGKRLISRGFCLSAAEPGSTA